MTGSARCAGRRRDAGSRRAYLAIGAFLLVHATTLGGRMVGAYWFLGGPLFTVLGDGYQEFERHLTPYLMLTPAVAMSVLRTDVARSQSYR